MSLVVSDFMAKLITEIPLITGFSDKKRLPNPYAIEQNHIKKLSNGWGLLMGSANLGMLSTKQASTDLAFTVSLTRDVTGSEEKPDVLDREIKAAQTDIHELILHLSSNQTVTWPDGVWDVLAVSTDGIEYFNDDKFRMISTAANFTVRIEETLD